MSDDHLLRKRVSLIQRAFGTSILDRDGVNVAVSCVNKNCSSFGKQVKKKLTLRVDNEFYHCWVCGLRGKGLGYFFKQYKPRYYSTASEIFEKKISEKKDDELPTIQLPDNFSLLAGVGKRADPDIRACLNYLTNRGFSHKDLWYFRLGAVSSGRYRRRVIIPSFDSEGELNYFTARAIDGNATRKYINPRVKRSEIIFNEMNIDWNSELTIVEGPFDLMKANQNCTCLLGSSLSERHFLFQRIATNKTPVLLALDPDASKKTQDIAKLLSSFDVDIRVSDVKPYNDVGEMPLGMFQQYRDRAKVWSELDRLKNMISGIKSGSLI
jgi:DNA primase